MRTTKKKEINFFETVKEFLPKKYITEISIRLDNKISSRQIRYILNGKRTDYFNVLDTAIIIANEEKAKRELIKKRLSKLTK